VPARGRGDRKQVSKEEGRCGAGVDAIHQLDALIDKGAKQGEAEKEREAMYAESVRRYHARRRKRNRVAWHKFHVSQAERIERTAASLAAEHRSKAEALLEEPGGGG
jgi:hypothetical protein